MAKNDWHSIDDIGNAISDIIDSGDFSKLNDSVANTTNQILDSIDQAVHGKYTSGSGSYRQNNRTYNRSSSTNNEYWEQRKEQWASTKRPAGAAFEHSYNSAYNTSNTKRASDRVERKYTIMAPWKKYPERYQDVSGTQVANIFELIGGGMLTAWGGLGFLANAMMTAFWVSMPLTGFLASAAVTAAGVGVLMHGSKSLRLVKNYKKYASTLRDREYCKVEDLAMGAGVTEDTVRKDVKRIIRKGWMRQGKLDAVESTLMVTNNAYSQYKQAYQSSIDRQAEMERAALLRKEQEKAEEVRKQKLAVNEAAQKVINEGRAYVEEIKRCNRNIPGVEVSEKISRMELVCDQIFNRVEEHPELIDELRKFMKYYLPTTVKLLQAYEKLDQEAVQGENIRKSKKEIETTLDTINTAFVNLLDGFFEDDVVDIKSDISVMQTMMAQEGLLHEDLAPDAVQGGVTAGMNSQVVQAAGGAAQMSGGYAQATGGQAQVAGGYAQATGGQAQATGGFAQVIGGYAQATQSAVAHAANTTSSAQAAVAEAEQELDAIQQLLQSGNK